MTDTELLDLQQKHGINVLHRSQPHMGNKNWSASVHYGPRIKGEFMTPREALEAAIRYLTTEAL